MSVADASSSVGVSPSEPAGWTLTDATEQERPLLAQLLQLYLHDFCDFDHADVDEAGRFSYRWLDDYGAKPGYHALVLRVDGRPAGFTLLEEIGSEDNPERHYIAEFFVLRSYRRRGYGAVMARALFDRFPGRWHVEEIARNTPAQAFWRRVIAAYTGGRYTEHVNERGEVIQWFDTRDRAG
jgi:predicted acetyltransferase